MSNLGLVLTTKQIIGRGYGSGGGGESVFLAFFGCPSCDLDAISIGGMEFCYLEFCLGFSVLVWLFVGSRSGLFNLCD